MSSIAIFWLVGCVVSFICGLLTPYYSKQKKFTSTDFLYSIICGCGSWLYSIIFIFSIVWRIFLTNNEKSESETSNDEGLSPL